MKRPRIKDLNEFVKLYNHIFMDDPPVVKWKKMLEYVGYADLNNNIIYLSTINLGSEYEHQFTGSLGIPEYVLSIKFRLKEDEQYFLTLLHEIGHFKMHYDPLPVPKEWDEIWEALKEFSRVGLSYSKEPSRKFNLDRYLIWHRLPPEDDDDALWRYEWARELLLDDRKKIDNEKDYCEFEREFNSLLSWLWGDWDTKHIAVEELARREFRKQRKRIRKILEGHR